MPRFSTAAFLIGLFVALAALPSSGQQPPDGFGVSMNALSSRVAIGEVGTLILKVTGVDASVPETIGVPGLDISHSGQNSKISIINQTQTIEVTHFYRFRGETPGTFTIPSLNVVLGTQTYSTNPLEITIYERDQNETIDATKPYFGKFELSKNTFYVNEIVPLTLSLYVQGRNSIQDVLPPQLEHESFIIKAFRDVQTDGADLGNTYYTSASLPSNLFALKAGEHRIGPATLGVRVKDNQGASFGFGGFFSRTVVREMATNTVNVTVKPLPPGAPVSFNGGVGIFELTATASTAEVSIGDPISMEFVVDGSGNFETLGAPVFKVPPTGLWKSYEPSKTFEATASENSGSSAGRTVFSQVIIPEAKVKSIPPFELTYFDPDQEKYVSLETPEIPITVSSDERSSAPATIRFPTDSGELTRVPEASRPNPQFDDILHIRKTQPRWISAASLKSDSTLFYLVQAVFSIGFFTVLGFGVIRRVKQREFDREGHLPVLSFRQSLKRIPKAGAPKREFYHAVSTSLMLWRDEYPDAPAPVLDIADRITDRCDTVLYSGANQSDGPVTDRDVAEIVPTLQKLAKK
ncbi:MAG: BatD family protein [Verrucomicrobiales bacterium]|nr:BatD family protein [Verrucomicrobiales bacterium]